MVLDNIHMSTLTFSTNEISEESQLLQLRLVSNLRIAALGDSSVFGVGDVCPGVEEKYLGWAGRFAFDLDAKKFINFLMYNSLPNINIVMREGGLFLISTIPNNRATINLEKYNQKITANAFNRLGEYFSINQPLYNNEIKKTVPVGETDFPIVLDKNYSNARNLLLSKGITEPTEVQLSIVEETISLWGKLHDDIINLIK